MLKWTLVVLVVVGGFILYTMSRRSRGELIAPAGELEEMYGLTAEDRPVIELDPSRVPEDLRDLIPMAEMWGIGDDVIRSDFEEKASEEEKRRFTEALRGRTNRITEWLDSFGDELMSEEAGTFMYMLEALDESGLWPDG